MASGPFVRRVLLPVLFLVGLLAGCGGGDDGGTTAATTPTTSASAGVPPAAKRLNVCFTVRALHLDGGEALGSISQYGQGHIGTSLVSIARRSFAPNIRRAVNRLRRSGSQDAELVASAADDGLERVLQDPKLLPYGNGTKLAHAFARARRLAEQSGFSHPHCSY